MSDKGSCSGRCWADIRGIIPCSQRFAIGGSSSDTAELISAPNGYYPEEMARAVAELTAGGPCEYAIIRVAQSVNRANSLRQWIKNDGHLAYPPTDAEYEVLAVARRPT